MKTKIIALWALTIGLYLFLVWLIPFFIVAAQISILILVLEIIIGIFMILVIVLVGESWRSQGLSKVLVLPSILGFLISSSLSITLFIVTKGNLGVELKEEIIYLTQDKTFLVTFMGFILFLFLWECLFDSKLIVEFEEFKEEKRHETEVKKAKERSKELYSNKNKF